MLKKGNFNSQPKRSIQQIEKLRSVFSALSSSVVFVPARGEGGERANFPDKRKLWTKILLVVNVGSHKKRSNQLNKLKKRQEVQRLLQIKLMITCVFQPR